MELLPVFLAALLVACGFGFLLWRTLRRGRDDACDRFVARLTRGEKAEIAALGTFGGPHQCALHPPDAEGWREPEDRINLFRVRFFSGEGKNRAEVQSLERFGWNILGFYSINVTAPFSATLHPVPVHPEPVHPESEEGDKPHTVVITLLDDDPSSEDRGGRLARQA